MCPGDSAKPFPRAAACGPDSDRGVPAAGRAESEPESSGEPSPIATEYSTSVLFLPYEAASTRALILDLSNYTASGRLSQRYLGWQLRGQGGWRSILDVMSESGTVRDPWRLLPADSLRLTVDSDGEPSSPSPRRVHAGPKHVPLRVIERSGQSLLRLQVGVDFCRRQTKRGIMGSCMVGCRRRSSGLG